MLSVSGLSKAFGGRTLWSDVGFRVLGGQRMALVGGNGAGKTTLIEALVGLGEVDTGEISMSKDTRVGYLPQELMESWSGSVLEEVMRGSTEILELEAELRRLEAALGEITDDAQGEKVLNAYGEAQTRFESLGGYQLESEARRILGGLGFTTTAMDGPLGEQSGGWQMRAALARLLLQKPDVLVLDEPTNHLDVDSVGWLEEQLRSFPGALIFVSHDRDFIDAVADRVLEIAHRTATLYVGGFAEFIVAREERIKQAEAAAAQQARKVAHIEAFVERFRYKATKARQVQSRIKTLEKLDAIEVPQAEELKLAFAFPEPARSSRVVVEIEGAKVGYPGGPPVISDVDLVIERGEKFAVVGPNGAGKSTLIKAILGQLAVSDGSVKIGANVDIAFFAQHQVDALDLSRTVEQEFRFAVGDQPKNRQLRTVLGSFGFSGDAVDRRVGDLSGGERTRLALAETMCNPVNLLVLDEPTNHLDLPSCDVLEDALSVYPGTVLLVSHDRHIIRNTVDGLITVRDGKVVRHDGVDEYVLNPTLQRPEPVEPIRTASPSATRGAKKGGKAHKRQSAAGAPSTKPSPQGGGDGAATRELRKAVARLEKQVGKAEEKVAELQRQLADPAIYDDADRLAEVVAAHDAAKDDSFRKMEEWETAMRRLDRAGG